MLLLSLNTAVMHNVLFVRWTTSQFMARTFLLRLRAPVVALVPDLAPVLTHAHTLVTTTTTTTTLVLAHVLVLIIGVLRRATTATGLATLHVTALSVLSATSAISLATLLVNARLLILLHLHPLLRNTILPPSPGAGLIQRAIQDPAQGLAHLVVLDPAPGVVLVHLADLQARLKMNLHHLLLQ